MAAAPRVLIAYDDGAPARDAVERAAALFPGAECVVASVVAGTGDLERSASATRLALSDDTIRSAIARLREAALAWTQELAERGAGLAADAGLRASPAVIASDASTARALAEAAREHAADVIVCGTRGQGAATRAILGSVSAGLVRHAGIPVLVVADDPVRADGPVLVGFDGSEMAEGAATAAARLLPGHEIVVLHAWRSQVRRTLTGRALERGPLRDIRELTESLDETFAQWSSEEAERGAALAREHGGDARPAAVESADPVAEALIAEAQRESACVLVIGRRGRNAVVSAVLGSVSASLLHASDRPVLVV